MNARCFSPDEEQNLGHMVFWSFYHWPALMFPCVHPCVSCSRATCIGGQWQTVLGLQLPETPDPPSSVLQRRGLFCLKRKLFTDIDQTHHEHHNHSIKRDSSLWLSTETSQEAEKLQCLLHTDRERTTEGPTPPTAALFPRGLTPQGWDSPVLEETPAATCKPFTSMRVAKLGTRYGTMPLNNTLKTFSVSYRVCFLYINLRKPQWDRLSSRSCPPTLQPVLQGAGTNPIDSLASIAAPSFMGWPTAANQSPSKKGKELVYVLRGWCTRN